METINAGHTMSLAALQRQDPYINKLLDLTGQVALYNFNSKANEWEKTDIEGTLFVYARSASPHYGFTIMNRLSTENLVEPINKDLEFQLQDPFLLYRNGNLGIFSIWFYDKRDCQRIAQLMVKIVKHEAEHAQGGSPERTNGVSEPRSIDILELLSKAKEEYQKAKEGETEATAETNVKAAISASEQAHSTLQPEKISYTMVKQITVEELFGSSLPKDLPSSSIPVHQITSASIDPSTPYLQSYSTEVHKNPAPPSHPPAPDVRSSQRTQATSHLPPLYGLNPSPVFQSMVPRSEPQPLCSVSPLMIPPTGLEPHAAPPGPSAPLGAHPAYFGKDIISKLKPAAPPVSMDIHKPVPAPNILSNELFPPHSFQEPIGNPHLQHIKESDVFSQPSNLIKPVSTVSKSPGLTGPASEISVLLSPSAFQQAINKKTATKSGVPPAPSETSVEGEGALLAPCSKTQLQETLIHLIKNDADFLGAIHDAYLQGLTKDFINMKV